MAIIHCTRCAQDRDQVPFRPFPNELGQRVLEQICNVCWSEWLKLQQQLINHYALNLRDPDGIGIELLSDELMWFGGRWLDR